MATDTHNSYISDPVKTGTMFIAGKLFVMTEKMPAEPNPEPSRDSQAAWEADVASRRAAAGGTETDHDDSEPTYKLSADVGGWQADLAPPIVIVNPQPIPQPRATKKLRAAQQAFWLLVTCNTLVFFSNVAVMTLELTASRLIARHVGSSLYTWTSVIGVVLAGMTIGNSLGGWLADNFDRRKTLAWAFFASSVACISVLWLDQVVPGAGRPAGMSWPIWIVWIVGAMFFLPALALGTISPLVASMALDYGRKTGSTVGNVYAWGAAGSIAGTFLTGFFLVDIFGTRVIVALVAASLAVMAFFMANSQRVFQAALAVGWIQTIGWLSIFATSTGSAWTLAAENMAGALYAFQSPSERQAKESQWGSAAEQCATKFHELGLLLSLRDDQIGEYHDESQYAYINVGTTTVAGDSIRFLRLDKLIHSYYSPTEPTKLYYDYERVYAAATELAFGNSGRAVSTVVSAFPELPTVTQALPMGVVFDEASRKLVVEEPTPKLLNELLDRSSHALYWRALEQLHKETTAGRWGGFSSVPLEALPEGVVLPAEIASTVHFDPLLKLLVANGVIEPALFDRLVRLPTQHPWYYALRELQQQSRTVSALFLGGGGYVFPRWLWNQFPGTQRIDVAELDPAVEKAVTLELGLNHQTAGPIRSHFGDARNVVDDLLASNSRSVKEGQPPALYRCIYGDAFNDFSIPWHLTTYEFNSKLRNLLAEDGLYMANVIDVYPRTEVDFPGTSGAVPARVHPETQDTMRWLPAPTPFEFVECRFGLNDDHRVAFRGEMSAGQRDRLLALADATSEWKSAVLDAYAGTRIPRGGQFLGRYARTLMQVFPCGYLFSSVEGAPQADRDTFVIVCSRKPLMMQDLPKTGFWTIGPFASWERASSRDKGADSMKLGLSDDLHLIGQMESVLALAANQILTDDFAPVDNLLRPLANTQE